MAAVGTLTIEMAANVARLQRDMDRATKTVGGAMDRIQRSVQGATRAMGLLTAAFAAYKSIQGIIQQADAMTLLNSRLQLVTKSQQEFIKTQEALISISQRSFTGLGNTVDLYTALSRATANLGVSQNELLRVVETFNKSIIISGGSVQAADAAITQFNQAMASGVLRGEEFNSISEQAPMIMELLANSLGVTRGALRDMAKEGLLVAELVLPALLEGSKSVDDQFAKLNKTIGQSGVQFKNQFALLIDELNKLTGGTAGASRGLDGFTFNLKILTDLLKAINGPAQAFNETQAETERLLRQNEQAAKANNEAVKSRAKAMLEEKERMEMAKKAAEELQKAYEKLIETLREDIRGSTAALQAEQQGLNKAQEDFLKLVSGPQWKQYTEAQRMLVTDLFKQRIETEKLIDAEKARAKAAEERLKTMLDDEKEFREELAKEDKKNEEDRIKAQEKLYDEHRKQIQKIEDDLTDALMRAFESGKGFGQAFKDTLVNMFRTMVLRPILAPISGAIAGAFGGGGAAAAGGAIPGGGAGMGFLGGLSVAASSLGVGMAAGFSNALTLNFAGSLTAAGQLIGTGTMAGISAGLGMAAGTLLPIVGLFAALPSINKFLFGGGTRVTGSGITGTFTTEGVDARQYVDKYRSGGLFKSSKSWTQASPIASELDKFLGDAVMAIGYQTRTYAELLNVNADVIDRINFSFAAPLQGLSQEQQQEVIAGLLDDFSRVLAEQLLGSFVKGTKNQYGEQGIFIAGPFVKEGEKANDALIRLANSLATVNQAFDTLGYSLLQASLGSADLASKLIDVFGGAEAFVEQTSAYYANFYTEAERTATITRQLGTIMGELGYALPTTRDQFRLLVESQDITTESGREMYAMLLGLAPVFAQISDGVEQIYQSAQEATNTALQVLQRSVAAQQDALRVSERVAQENVDAIRSVFDVLQSSIRGLTGGGFTFESGRAFISQALQTAQGVGGIQGPLPSAEQLQAAIGAVSSGLTPSSFASALEFRREQASFVSQLTQLQGFTQDQLSTAEKQLIAITDQITKLDEQILLAQNQINELRGINISVLSVADAIYNLEETLISERAALSDMTSASGSSTTSSQQTVIETRKLKDSETLIRDLHAAGGYPITDPEKNLGPWIAHADKYGNINTIAEWSKYNRGTTSPYFQAGGLHTGGMRIVGERGPEMEITGPARYMSNATLASMMGNGNGEELKQLREENKVQMRALVSLQNRMTKIIEQWNGDGLPTERVEA